MNPTLQYILPFLKHRKNWFYLLKCFNKFAAPFLHKAHDLVDQFNTHKTDTKPPLSPPGFINPINIIGNVFSY